MIQVDLTSVAMFWVRWVAEVACKIQLRHKFRQQTRPEAEVWNAKFSQCRQDVDGAGGVAWIGLASYHLCYALPLPGTYSAQRKAAMHGDCGAIQSGGRRRSAACCFLIAFSCSASVFWASHILYHFIIIQYIYIYIIHLIGADHFLRHRQSMLAMSALC